MANQEEIGFINEALPNQANERISKNDTQGSHESSCSLLPCDEIAKFLSRSLVHTPLPCLLAVACLGYVFLRRPLDLLFYGMALICFLCPLVVITAVLAAVKPPSGSAFKLDSVQDLNLRLGIGRSLTICKYFYAQVVQKLTFLGISFVVLSLHFVSIEKLICLY